MNFKNFLIAAVIGGIADFLLGWLLYGIVFKDYSPEEMPNLLFIFLGCMSFGFLASYIVVRLADLITFLSGAKAGAVVGLLIGLMNNFFLRSNSAVVDYDNFAIDVLIGIIIGAIVGGIITAVNGALKPTT